MMSVLEYAQDVSLSVEEVLKLCEGLDFPKSSEEDMLNDEEITILDGEVQNLDNSNEEPDEVINEEYNDDEFFEKVETLAEAHLITGYLKKLKFAKSISLLFMNILSIKVFDLTKSKNNYRPKTL